MRSKKILEKAVAHSASSRKRLSSIHPNAQKKLDSLRFHFKDIRRHSAKMFAASVLAGSILLGSHHIEHKLSHVGQKQVTLSVQETQQHIRAELTSLLPKQIRPLTPQEENKISETIHQTLGIKAVATLDSNHLNTTYGRIGGEQHLPRYPGDAISDHDALQQKGITAHRGAFGYFTSSEDHITQEVIEREKYYVAVQTLYLPDWNANHKTLKEWYKFRKVLVINPTTGKSIVAVIGDAGPAAWTGKHFGGSPEIMQYLEPYANKNNGAVVLFFIDDTEQPVALGPVDKTSTRYLAVH